VLPHHASDNGGLLAAQYLFRGDTSRVEVTGVATEAPVQPNAIIITVGDVNHIVDSSRAAFDFAAAGCSKQFRDAPAYGSGNPTVTCPASVGALRPLQLFSNGPGDLLVEVANPDGSTWKGAIPHYYKKSNAVGWWPYGFRPNPEQITFGGYAMVVRAGAVVTIVAPADVAAVDFGHANWPTEMVESITLNLDAPAGGRAKSVANCVLRTDHPRPWMSPYGPLGDLNAPLSELCV
jgi:hypothetical protein